ncbi:MAG: WD40 repeat domain-containing protein [Thermoguttaceae bacterium]
MSLSTVRKVRWLAALFLPLGSVAFSPAAPPTCAPYEYSVGRVPSMFVFSVAFAPDGKTFAAADKDRLRIYETASHKLLRTIMSKSKKDAVAKFPVADFSPIPDMIRAVTFSPDGKLLAGCRSDATVCLWKTVGDEQPAVLEAHTGSVKCGRFSPDGTLLATGSQDHNVLLWDVRRQAVKAVLSGHESWVECLAFSSTGKLLASGSEDDTARLWDVSSGKEIRTMEGAKGALKSIAFSPDDKLLLCGDQHKEIQVWDVATGRNRGTLRGHTDTVSGLFVLRDNRTAISASLDHTVRAWDLGRQEQVGSLTTPWSSIWSMAVSPDQKSILCGQIWGPIQLIPVDRLLGKMGGSEGAGPSAAGLSGDQKK